MTYLNSPVAYLVDDDFDSKGNLTNTEIPKNKPALIMVQSNFCGHCTKAKPAYQQFAEKNKDKVFCATVQGDGTEPGEKELSSRLKSLIPGFRGFPEYVLFVNGKMSKKHDGGRDVESLEKFVFGK